MRQYKSCIGYFVCHLLCVVHACSAVATLHIFAYRNFFIRTMASEREAQKQQNTRREMSSRYVILFHSSLASFFFFFNIRFYFCSTCGFAESISSFLLFFCFKWIRSRLFYLYKNQFIRIAITIDASIFLRFAVFHWSFDSVNETNGCRK